MTKFLVSGGILASAVIAGIMLTGAGTVENNFPLAQKDSLRALKNYTTYCGGCHGEKMDAFVDRNWKHGNNREDLFKAIKIGYPDEGMPAFDSAFSDEEMYELADYMLKGISYLKNYQFQDQVVTENRFTAAGLTITLDTVVSGLRSAWGMSFLPDGSMLVTDKFGKLYLVGKDRNKKEVSGLPSINSDGQGGLMDVLVHPQFETNHYIYLSYSKKKDNANEFTTAIVRGKLTDNNFSEVKEIFEAYPYSRTRHHYGSRMLFDRQGYLFFSVGERGNEKENPQNLASDLGKIHRLHDDGRVPTDNPFVAQSAVRPSIWSYGHRNPQGLTMHPKTGEIWSHEHGPRGGDEINLVKKGANYGWPVITYGINYNGKTISNKTAEPGMEQPLKYWIPSIAPCGMDFVEGSRYKGWEGGLLSGSLRFKYLNLSKISGHQVGTDEFLLKNIGRIRDVRMGPDGFIYVSVENPGYVFRLLVQE